MISKYVIEAMIRLLPEGGNCAVDCDDTEQIRYENVPEEDQPTQEEIIAEIEAYLKTARTDSPHWPIMPPKNNK